MHYDPSQPEFTDEVIQRLPEFIINEQATLVLFSSYKQMQQARTALEHKLKCPILVQGEASRQHILKQHKERCQTHKPSVIFGTSSFSEGLDLPGDYLTNLQRWSDTNFACFEKRWYNIL